MLKRMRVFGVVGLVLGVGVVAVGQQPGKPRPPSPTVTAVLRLADDIDRPDVAALARDLVEQYDPCGMSRAFNPVALGGVGIGSARQAGHQGDSIELLIKNWSGPRPPTRDELREHRQDLLRVARVIQAMAELAPHRQNNYVNSDRPPAVERWRRVSADFKAVSRELRDAIDRGRVGATRKAAVRLQQTCNACHDLAGR
jgi:hypothetical protein